MATYQTINLTELIKGSRWDGLQITLYSDTAQTIPIDLTDCVITYKIKEGPQAVSQSTWSTAESTITITGADSNIITIVGRNMEVKPATYYGDIDILFPDGALRTWFRTKMSVIQDYTN